MRQSIPAVSAWAQSFGYVRAVRVGPLVEIGGTVALDQDGEVVAPGNTYEQAKRALEIIGAALDQLGLERSAIVRTRVFLRHIERWDEAGRAHREFFEGCPLPASSCVGGAELLLPTLDVEVEATAWVE